MEFLKTWVTSIAVIIIFSTLIEILMPSSDMKRFVKVFTGLLVILVIVQPFVFIKDIKNQFNLSILETSSILDTETDVQSTSNINAYQSKQTIELYRKKISDYVTDIIIEQYQIDRKDIKVDLEIDQNRSKDFGKIIQVFITIKNGQGHAVSVSKIENVDINRNKTGMNKSNKEYNFNDSQLSKKIKSNLSKVLNIDESKINIQE